MSDLAGVRALLLDVDGTLVDSVYLHIVAWQGAVRDAGLDVPAAVVHAAIGLDSEKLLAATAPEADERQQERIVKRHAKRYARMVADLRRLPGARELIAAAHARGIRTVLATSAPQSELDHLLRVLDADDLLDAVTGADEVGAAKPEPDVFEAAVERAGVPRDGCLVVGDARWDMIAARRAGLTAVGVQTGGVDPRELLAEGGVEVYRDAQALLDAFRTAWDRDDEGIRRAG